MSVLPTYLDALIYGLKNVLVNGVDQATEVGINLIGNITAVDNPSNNRLDLTFGYFPMPGVASTITANTSFTRQPDQVVGVDASGGGLTMTLPVMQLGDVFRFEDWGNDIHTHHVLISWLANMPTTKFQDPHTFAVSSVTSFNWGVNEASGSTLTLRLVHTTGIGNYLKVIS